MKTGEKTREGKREEGKEGGWGGVDSSKVRGDRRHEEKDNKKT